MCVKGGLIKYLGRKRGRCILMIWLVCSHYSWASSDTVAVTQPESGASAKFPAMLQRAGFSIQVAGVELEVLLKFIAQEFGWRLITDMDQALLSAPTSLSVSDERLETVLAAIPDPTAGELIFELQSPDLRVAWIEEVQDGALTAAQSADKTSSQPESGMVTEPVLQTRFYQVHYADAVTLLSLIQDKPGTAGWLSEQGRAQLDERSNTLVVTDEPQRLSMVEVLLSELDVPVSQVLVQAWVISASVDSARELGVHWQALRAIDDGVNGESFSQGGVSAAPGQSSGVWRLSLGSGLQLQGGMNRSRFQLELDLAAMQAEGQVELLARPSIMTRANQQASIQSGVRVPYQSQAGGTAGGSVTQFVDAVLSLAVMPRITPDGQVLMDLEVRQDAVAAGNAPVPAINTNTIATQVRLANRETLVLGGIFSDQVSENESGVPGLSRIPGVGKLFRQTRHSTQRSELLLFITPVIIPAH